MRVPLLVLISPSKAAPTNARITIAPIPTIIQTNTREDEDLASPASGILGIGDGAVLLVAGPPDGSSEAAVGIARSDASKRAVASEFSGSSARTSRLARATAGQS